MNVDLGRPGADLPANDLQTELLKSVSRAFYLSLRVLPRDCRLPMATGYLLARSADTIADTDKLSPPDRARALAVFRELVRGGEGSLEELIPASDGSAEARLLARLPDSLKLLATLPAEDQTSVRRIVETLAKGMQADLEHFPPGGPIQALETPADLDRHTYLAAGCVGQFWTEILHRHVPALKSWDVNAMSALGVRFGKALQLVNVLRDIPGDLAEGRCYIPRTQLEKAGLTAADLLTPENWPRLRPIYQTWLNLALDHFKCAQKYILAIPSLEIKLRLSVLWPVLIGLATLDRLAESNPLLPHRIKVPRSWVYRTLLLSIPAAPLDALLRRWVRSWRWTVERKLTERSRPETTLTVN